MRLQVVEGSASGRARDPKEARVHKLVGIGLLLILAGFGASLPSAEATGPYTAPTIWSTTITFPANLFFPQRYANCLIRSDTAGSQVTGTGICYWSYSPSPAPPPPPPPFNPLAQQAITGTINQQTGILTIPVLNCLDALGIEGISLTATIQLTKAGGPTTGTMTQIEDTSSSRNCTTGTQTTGQIAVAPLSTTTDTDGDGCPDYKELGSDPTLGGLRDPFNPYDTWDPQPNTSTPPLHNITAGDIFAVVQHFGSSDPNWQRTLVGPNPWNLGPKNITVSAQEILITVRMFGTYWTCP